MARLQRRRGDSLGRADGVPRPRPVDGDRPSRAHAPDALGFGVELLAVVPAATLPFAAASRAGPRATGIGYDRRVTIIQFVAGFALFIVTIAATIGEARALSIVGGVAVLSLLWGVFNTWELIVRVQRLDTH